MLIAKLIHLSPTTSLPPLVEMSASRETIKEQEVEGERTTGLKNPPGASECPLVIMQLITNKGFPGGSVAKNPSANAGDTGSIPDLARSHLLQLLEPVCPGVCASRQEKPLQWEAHAPQLESSSCSPQLQKSLSSTEDPVQPKINKQNYKKLNQLTLQ